MRSSIVLLMLTLCACSQRAADELYVLKANAAGSGGKMPVTLIVAEPEVAPGLDTERIAVEDAPNHLTYYTGAAWAQPLPQTLQVFFIDGLQQSHAFKSVGSDQDGSDANFKLLTDIQDYEVKNASPAPSVRVRLVAKLLDVHSNKVVASFAIDKTAVAEVNHMPAIIAAFNSATNEAAAIILRNIRKYNSEKPTSP